MDPNLPSKTYSVTPDEVTSFRSQLAAQGDTVPDGDSGQITIKQYGVVLAFEYDPSATPAVNNLKVGIVSEEWWETSGEIFNHIQQYLPSQPAA